MNNTVWKELRELQALMTKRLELLGDSIRDQLQAANPTGSCLQELVDESHAGMLSSLTGVEAVQYLKSTEDAELLKAYLVLAKKFMSIPDTTVIAELCMECLSRPSQSAYWARLICADSIGIWVEGTGNKEASQALASIIRDSNESDQIRIAAYSSLELINGKDTVAERLRRKIKTDDPPSTALQEIDWSFVKYFLQES